MSKKKSKAVKPVGGLLPDFQPTLDKINAVMDSLKPTVDGLKPIPALLVGIIQAVQAAGLTITIHIAVGQQAGPYPRP